MSGFSPIIPLDGYSGWRFLERTAERQQATFNKGAGITRELEYFSKNITETTSAMDLVSDRRLLRVALGAFGLEDDIDKKAYILKVLEEGTSSPKAFANRIADKRYRAFANAFGFGTPLGSKIGDPGFVDRIATQFKLRKFEVSVGEVDESMRLAMGFSREISVYANSGKPDSTTWLQILGNPPIRAVFEGAFGLPASFGRLDVDKQMQVFEEKTSKLLGEGSPSIFENPSKVEKLLQSFFLRRQIANAPSSNSRGSIALLLLSHTANSMAGLVQSRIL